MCQIASENRNVPERWIYRTVRGMLANVPVTSLRALKGALAKIHLFF
jgi:hypothetical protein